ncbi:MAG: dolichyldiphosphatase [Edafosvirus sp.]|uniref:Dolichyldiphosphatase n=1 Tax=Edafosvirus sp. TaxID=2487765 RepID=A0A3G4ZT25_9VIRU|nr:MAG: dolichyldiphosphatase [Edafosvirus sp.]
MSEQLVSIPGNLAKSLPYTIYSAGYLSSIVTGNPLGAVFSTSAIIFGDVLNGVLKKSIKSVAPDVEMFKRPSPPAEGCGIYSQCNISADHKPTYGMPSGHSMIICFSAIFWILYIQKYSGMSKGWKLFSTILLLTIAILVMISRIVIGCHNFLQVIVGAMIGILLGWVVFVVLENVWPSLFVSTPVVIECAKPKEGEVNK